MAENWKKFKFEDNGYIILRTITEYSMTESGKSWRKRPDVVKREVISAEFYTNYVTAIPFFNNFGDGAYCRGKRGYTCAGYLPTEIVTVGPNMCKKVVAEFDFINKTPMAESAGWREREVMEKAKHWSMEIYSDWSRNLYGRRITFHTDDDGVTASATWDTGLRRWVD